MAVVPNGNNGNGHNGPLSAEPPLTTYQLLQRIEQHVRWEGWETRNLIRQANVEEMQMLTQLDVKLDAIIASLTGLERQLDLIRQNVDGVRNQVDGEREIVPAPGLYNYGNPNVEFLSIEFDGTREPLMVTTGLYNKLMSTLNVQKIIRLVLQVRHLIPELQLYWQRDPPASGLLLPAVTFELCKAAVFQVMPIRGARPDTPEYIELYENRLAEIRRKMTKALLHYRTAYDAEGRPRLPARPAPPAPRCGGRRGAGSAPPAPAGLPNVANAEDQHVGGLDGIMEEE